MVFSMLLKFAYEDFIADRRFKNTTEANIQNYKQLLLPFVEFCHSKGAINIEDVRPSHLKEYLLICQENGNKPNTINTKIMRIRAFFNYLVEEKIVTENIAKKVKLQKADVKIDVFTDEHIRQMLAYYRGMRRKEKSYFSYRGYLLILTFLSTGIRRKEAIMLKWSDVDLKNLTMSVYGKSRQYETVFLTEKLAKELMVYRSFCLQHFGHDNEYVFLNRDNAPMTDFSISQLFDNLRVDLGVNLEGEKVMQKDMLLITEKELIELTMEYGYSGSELNNTHFLEKGFLKKNGSYNSFIKKVESICESWNRLKKKKGQPVMYEIFNLYEEKIPISSNRINNGKKPTLEDLIMRNYIYFALGINEVNDGKVHSLNKWATLFQLASNQELEEVAKTDVFNDMYWNGEITKVVSTFKSTIIKRNRDVISNSFKHLEKQNKIKKNEVPIFIHLNRSCSTSQFSGVFFSMLKLN